MLVYQSAASFGQVMEVDEVPPHGEDFHPPAVGSLLVIHKPRDAREFIPELFKKRWDLEDCKGC